MNKWLKKRGEIDVSEISEMIVLKVNATRLILFSSSGLSDQYSYSPTEHYYAHTAGALTLVNCLSELTPLYPYLQCKI